MIWSAIEVHIPDAWRQAHELETDIMDSRIGGINFLYLAQYFCEKWCTRVLGTSDDISAQSQLQITPAFLSITPSTAAVGSRICKRNVRVNIVSAKKRKNQLPSRSGGGSLLHPLNSKAARVSHLTDFNEGTSASSSWLLRQQKILTEETFTIEWNYNKAWGGFIFYSTLQPHLDKKWPPPPIG